ncbi:internal virion protein [Yersinia phage vB_YenP_Rambo]|uniref:Internal virion protein n=1 Tax=Yersinia phage vB_YenP_Rambo TaxID=2880894 RepID=A0AC61TNX2_9CAUD|nr:internal virion protein [Yersinia phage vB_YenP_Rambo]
MSKIDSALQAAQQGMSRLRSGSGGMGYRAATTYAEQPRSSLLDSLGKFAQAGADIYKAKEQRARDLADERSNEIIRKLTPEQRREALNNGTLLYQDDPYAMEALRVKTGRNAAYLVDDEVMQKVKNGEFRTREEMEQYRHARLQEGAKSYAEQFGINPEDIDYQRGFNGDITERNISLYGAHDNFLSQQAQKGAIMNSRVELNGVLQDPAMLRRPDSAEFFEKYIANGLVTGAIPSDAQATQLIGQAFSDASSRAGGADFLLRVGDRKVTLNGVTTTYKELMGDEQWNALMVTAQRSQFENDAKMNEAYRLKINSALNQEDPRTAWEMLQGIKAELDKVQPDEQMTPQREWLISAQTQVQDQMNAWTKQQAKALDDSMKTQNKMDVIDAQFQKRIKGDWVSTDYKDMPTNENTGEFKHSDMVNYANAKLAEIDRMDVPEAVKDKMKLQYLQADSKDGAFRTAIGTMVTDAAQEWSASVINGKLPENTPALDSLRRIRNADPQLIAGLYPDQAELFLTMDMMDRQGIDPQVILDADRLVARRSKEQRFEDDKAFESALNASTAPEISRMPASLREAARKIYDSVKYRSGNESMAMEQMTKFLQESTFTFTDDDVDKGTVGVIPKKMLQVNADPKSWEQGRDILDEARKGIITNNPWIANKQLTMYSQGDSIYLMDTTGQVRVRYDKELLSKVWSENQSKLAEKARDEAIAKANKRAPIAAAAKARKELKRRAKERQKQVPKYIYGRKEEK